MESHRRCPHRLPKRGAGFGCRGNLGAAAGPLIGHATTIGIYSAMRGNYTHRPRFGAFVASVLAAMVTTGVMMSMAGPFFAGMIGTAVSLVVYDLLAGTVHCCRPTCIFVRPWAPEATPARDVSPEAVTVQPGAPLSGDVVELMRMKRRLHDAMVGAGPERREALYRDYRWVDEALRRAVR